ncbi:MAG: site-2 protease family protein [Verrucomicrobiales bacterium]|nr:site-2 protease family protein [Verrucomicrobiales bacterium]
MLSFRLFGFPVRVQWIFWVLCLILGMNYLQSGGPDGVIKALIVAAIVFGSILWHELGHAWARKKSGAPYSEIMLHGFGGVCSGPGSFTRGQSIFIAAAGPASSLALGFITFLAVIAAGDAAPWMQFFAGWMLWVNIGWAILNLLPIFPLDGGQIFAGIAGPRNLKLVLWVGLILSATLAVAGLLVTKQFFMAILFGMLAFGNWQRLQGKQSSFL